MTYTHKRIAYTGGGPPDGFTELFDVSSLYVGFKHVVVIGEVNHSYEYDGRRFVFKRSYRPGREIDCGAADELFADLDSGGAV